jgi:chemotaxis signal transduction protein
MIAMVRFRAAGASYAIPVSDVRQVRQAAEVSALPAARTGVAGVIRQGGAALPVLSILGGAPKQVLLLEAGGRGYGLLVEEVSTVTNVDERGFGPPPDGQDVGLVTGVLETDAELVLVMDAAALGTRFLG